MFGYNTEMNTEQFQAIVRQQPFRPFTIRMADGRSFTVNHPDFVAQFPSRRSIIVFQPDDSFSVLDMVLMSELEVAAPSARQNGES
jgi:hypothetical protein